MREPLAVVHHPSAAAHHDHAGEIALCRIHWQIQVEEKGALPVPRINQVRHDADTRRRTVLNEVLFSLTRWQVGGQERNAGAG